MSQKCRGSYFYIYIYLYIYLFIIFVNYRFLVCVPVGWSGKSNLMPCFFELTTYTATSTITVTPPWWQNPTRIDRQVDVEVMRCELRPVSCWNTKQWSSEENPFEMSITLFLDSFSGSSPCLFCSRVFWLKYVMSIVIFCLFIVWTQCLS